MATVRFPKPEVILSQQWIEISHGIWYAHRFSRMQSLNLNSEVDFQLYDRHLKKSI